MKKTLLPVAVLSVVAVPAFAETTPSGFTYSGELAYESSNGSSDTVNIGTIDVRLGYGFALDNGLTVGVNTRYRSESLDFTGSNAYGNLGNYTAYVSGNFGTVSVGRISAPSGDVQDATPIGGALLFGISEYSIVTGGRYASYVEAEGIYGNFDYTGIRYDGTFGNTTVAIGYSDIENGTTTVWNAGLRSKIDAQNTVYASLETLSTGGTDFTVYALGSETTFAKGKLGIRGRRVSTFFGNATTGDVYFDYKLLDKLTITPEYTTLSYNSGATTTTDWFSLTAKYELPFPGVTVYAIYSGENSLSRSDLTTVGLRVKF